MENSAFEKLTDNQKYKFHLFHKKDNIVYTIAMVGGFIFLLLFTPKDNPSLQIPFLGLGVFVHLAILFILAQKLKSKKIPTPFILNYSLATSIRFAGFSSLYVGISLL